MQKNIGRQRKDGKELPPAISLVILAFAIAGTAAVHYFLLAPSGAQTANPKRLGQLYLIILSIVFFALYLPAKYIYNHLSHKQDPLSMEQSWWEEND